MTRSFFVRAAVVASMGVAALAAAPAAQAQRLNFNGAARVGTVADQPGTLFIDFLAGATPVLAGTPTGTVLAVPTLSGPFASILPGTTGTITDISGTAAGINGLPIADFLTIGGYTFSLTGSPAGSTIGPITLVGIGSSTTALFSVNGGVTGGAFGSNGTYTAVFSAQFAGINPTDLQARIAAGEQFEVSFSAEIRAAVVPEPSTYALMGAGLGALALVGARRRRDA